MRTTLAMSQTPGKILITGGAGFVGAHLAERLLHDRWAVRILDNFSPQVHGGAGPESLPAAIRKECEIQVGSVVSAAAMERALQGVRTVAHLAAAVGVGQSMYRIRDYCRANMQGTAQLLQAILQLRKRGQEPPRLLVASSMSIYGEGSYVCRGCGPMRPAPRGRDQLERGEWELRCPGCGRALASEATDEAKPADPQSIYAIGKLSQEQMVLTFARAYGVPGIALRFFNIYGPRQALSNPYTGVVAIFCARARAGEPMTLYEDGEQQRDFVAIEDVVEACALALGSEDASGAYNIGSGRRITIRRVAEEVAAALQTPARIETSGRYRVGDIRHCRADISRARKELGYEPRVGLTAGLRQLAEWISESAAPSAPVANAAAELRAYGLGG